MLSNFIKYNLTAITLFATGTLSAQTVELDSAVDWSMFYVGLIEGYSWGLSDVSTRTSYVPTSYFGVSDVAQINGNGSSTLNPNSFTSGLLVGVNYQMGRLVLGTEMDFGSFQMSSSHNTTVGYQSVPPYTFNINSVINTDWLFMARPRIGLAVKKALVYVTSGLALTNLRTKSTFSDNYTNPPPSNAFESATASMTKVGWTVGGGLQIALSNHWALKAEYLYADFGRVSYSGELSLSPAYLAVADPPIAPPSPLNHSANLTANIVRLGLNYKLNI